MNENNKDFPVSTETLALDRLQQYEEKIERRVVKVEEEVSTAKQAAEDAKSTAKVVEKAISSSIEEALFGKNSAIKNNLDNLQNTVKSLPTEERVDNMINKSFHEMSTQIATMNANIANLAVLPAMLTRLEDNLRGDIKSVNSNLLKANDVKVLINDEAKISRRWLIGTCISVGGVVFAALHFLH